MRIGDITMQGKTRKNLSPDELIDVLFQKPGRVTQDLLDKRNPLQTMRDSIMTYSSETGYVEDYIGKGPIQSGLDSLMLPFFRGVSMAQHHPQALINGMRELRYVGYTTQQIRAIRRCLVGHITTLLFDSKDPLSQKLYKTNLVGQGEDKRADFFFNDGAHLGVGCRTEYKGFNDENHFGLLCSGNSDRADRPSIVVNRSLLAQFEDAVRKRLKNDENFLSLTAPKHARKMNNRLFKKSPI